MMETLPVDILLQITDKLNARSLDNLARTSRSLHRVLHPTLYRRNVLNPGSFKRGRALCHALQNGVMRTLELALEQGADIEEARTMTVLDSSGDPVEYQESLLMLAFLSRWHAMDLTKHHWSSDSMASCQYDGIVRFFCNSNLDKDIMFPTGHGRSPVTLLHLAAGRADYEMVRLLLEHGADAHKTNASGETALHLAAVPQTNPQESDCEDSAPLKIIRLLLCKGLDIDCRSSTKRTPLHYAVGAGNSSIVRFLIANGADIKARDFYGYMPCHEAAWTGRVECITLWTDNVDLGARTQNGSTLLHLAAAGGHVLCCQQLLSMGADIEARCNDQCTPLLRASAFKRQDVMRFLTENNADPNVQDTYGMTPLNRAILDGSPEIVSMLLKAGAKAGYQPIRGHMPLQHAIWPSRGGTEIVELLLDAGANVNAKDRDGDTPLHVSSNSKPGIVKFLLDAGADVNAKDRDGNTPLHLSYSSRKKTVKLLLDAGADVNAKNNRGATPLHEATRFEWTKTTALVLLDRGAYIEARDNNGHTALFYAREGRRGEIEQMLVERGAKG